MLYIHFASIFGIRSQIRFDLSVSKFTAFRELHTIFCHIDINAGEKNKTNKQANTVAKVNTDVIFLNEIDETFPAFEF